MAGDFICNIAVLGKTGVGKSSLLNYLCGTNFETGTGKPVTGVGLFEEEAELNGQKVRVFDSWGVEPDKMEEWEALIRKEKRKRDGTHPPSEWFHAVVYCVSAVGDRVEGIDAGTIQEFMTDGYRVVAALTKSSQNGTQHTSTMERTIREFVAQKLGSEGAQMVQKQLAVIPVCAVEKKLRSVTTLPFGKEALARAVLDSWRVTVLGRLPSAVIERLQAKVHGFVDNEIEQLNHTKVSGNLDASMNRKIVDGFYYRLNAFTNDLLQTKYSGIVRELIEQASDIETALMKAMSIPSDSDIASAGISHFREEIKERVTGATWAGRIASFGISAIVCRFSSDAQWDVRTKIESEFRTGEKKTCDSIAAKKSQVEKDVQYLLAQGGAQ